MNELILDFIRENILYILGAIGTVITFMNKKVQDFIRKPFVKKKDKIDLEESELNLNEKQLRYMEKYLEFQDERFVKLLENQKLLLAENEKLLKEFEESKQKCKLEMESYKRYLRNAHSYIKRLQKLLSDNQLKYEKFDDEGLF